MTDHECIIGKYISYDNRLVTLRLLLGEIQRVREFNESLEAECRMYEQGGNAGLADEIRKHKRTEYGMDSFCDRRRKSPLYHFDYCPICGKKIDWKAMRDAE